MPIKIETTLMEEVKQDVSRRDNAIANLDWAIGGLIEEKAFNKDLENIQKVIEYVKRMEKDRTFDSFTLNETVKVALQAIDDLKKVKITEKPNGGLHTIETWHVKITEKPNGAIETKEALNKAKAALEKEHKALFEETLEEAMETFKKRKEVYEKAKQEVKDFMRIEEHKEFSDFLKNLNNARKRENAKEAEEREIAKDARKREIAKDGPIVNLAYFEQSKEAFKKKHSKLAIIEKAKKALFEGSERTNENMSEEKYFYDSTSQNSCSLI